MKRSTISQSICRVGTILIILALAGCHDAVARLEQAGALVSDRDGKVSIDLSECTLPSIESALKPVDHDNTIVNVVIRDTVCSRSLLSLLGKLHGLKSVECTKSRLADDAVSELVRLAPEHLGLAYTDVDNRGVSRVLTIPELRSLSLRETSITDAAFNDVQWPSQFTFLNISDTAVTNRGVLQLAECTSLRTLYLENVRIDDECASGFSRMSNLEELSLRGTNISDNTLSILAGLPKLTTVHIFKTRVTEKGVKLLRSRGTVVDIRN